MGFSLKQNQSAVENACRILERLENEKAEAVTWRTCADVEVISTDALKMPMDRAEGAIQLKINFILK